MRIAGPLLLALLTTAVMGEPAPRSEPAVQRTVLEDDAVRIDELRVRGQVQRILVSPKASGVRAYEIVPADPGRDPSQQRGIMGQRLWHLFSF